MALLGREIPYLLAQHGMQCLVASDRLFKLGQDDLDRDAGGTLIDTDDQAAGIDACFNALLADEGTICQTRFRYKHVGEILPWPVVLLQHGCMQ